MCTLTWQLQADCGGYRLLFNRDEQRTRSPGLPPQIWQQQDNKGLAPIDSQAGGHWISVNQSGLTLALLNHYQADAVVPVHEQPLSRGHLVQTLRHLTNSEAVLEYLTSHFPIEYLSRFRPFQLLMLEKTGSALRTTWDGKALKVVPQKEPFLSSSGYSTQEVLASRKRWFDEHEHLDRYQQQAFHASHWPQRGAFSVCMHRDDARTVSVTEVTVSESLIAMRYAPGPLCQADWLPALELPITKPSPEPAEYQVA